MTSKPKLGGSDPPRKYKLKAEEPKTDQFTDLFGKCTIFLNIYFKSQRAYK